MTEWLKMVKAKNEKKRKGKVFQRLMWLKRMVNAAKGCKMQRDSAAGRFCQK
jgi:hypothetical protein